MNGRERVNAGKFLPSHRSISAVALSFIVQDPRGIIEVG